MATGPPYLYYHTKPYKLPVYKGVNVCMFTKISHLCSYTLFNTTLYLGANTSANNSSAQ